MRTFKIVEMTEREDESIFILPDNEFADPRWGRSWYYLTDKMIDALINGHKIYIDLGEYAVVLEHEKQKKFKHYELKIGDVYKED